MTDRDVLFFVFCGLIGLIVGFVLSADEKPLAIAIGVLLSSHLYDWYQEPDHGEKRPVLTVLAEVAGIIGCVIAFAEFVTR
ncbi:hypothetical protein ACFTTN_37375 [Streptomyces niveus]|uniref:hypothetical protein n=1 Tax=Streptomyces niveus TaxID=193462 RepID=UPI003632DBF0